ncbi:unnamed protein product [Ectocarpus sp. CCAP 1310/34]|nr:unnamed protein product [Ectocarpus sp. CCAP 1310/34]
MRQGISIGCAIYIGISGGIGGGSGVHRSRAASYGGSDTIRRDKTGQRTRHRRSHSRDSQPSLRRRSLSRTPTQRPICPPEGIFSLDAGGLGAWETLKGAAGVKSPGGWSSGTSETDSTDAEAPPEVETGADIEFVLVVAGGHDLNDECIFEAMTPPEYGLEEFVDGVEALDMPDDVINKVHGDASETPAGAGGGIAGGSNGPKKTASVSIPPSVAGGGGGGGGGVAGSSAANAFENYAHVNEAHSTSKKK